ncbi:MAG: hypothetical protein J5755_04015, partial [Clostridia bacterium]|nr:hypothetical protein [Clostridia bacterium]
MNEITTTLKRIAVYYLLLAINVIFCANIVADVFPTRNLSTVYLLVLSACLVLYYAHRVVPSGHLSFMTKALSVMAVLLILLRGVKYSAVSEIGVLARLSWYLYYVPILLIPLFLFAISLLVSAKGNSRLPALWFGALGLTVALLVLVLTNDLHHQAFVFQEGFADWDSNYTYGWLFYVVNAWQFALSLTSIVILIYKCRVTTARKNAWIILLPFALGIVMYALLLTDAMPKINGAHLIEFPEAHIFTAAAVLECCMSLGLIPTNTDYGKMFRNLSLAAQITDRAGTPVYSSAEAMPLTADQFALPDGSRIDEHTVLHKMPLSGGYGFWQDDLTNLDRLNAELEEAKEGLMEEAELARLQNELKEKQAKIEQRTKVYDAIARRIQTQSQAISSLAKRARETSDGEVREECRRQITLLGAYIKRYANLTLLAEENDLIASGELGLAVSEVLRYLNYAGKPGELVVVTEALVPSQAAIAVFEAFETL